MRCTVPPGGERYAICPTLEAEKIAEFMICGLARTLDNGCMATDRTDRSSPALPTPPRGDAIARELVQIDGSEHAWSRTWRT